MSSFVITQLKKGLKVIKPWYGCMLSDELTVEDLYRKFISGELDDGTRIENCENEDVETVLAYAGKSRDSVTIKVNHSVPIHVIVTSIGMFIEFRMEKSTPVEVRPKGDAFEKLMENAKSNRCLPESYENTEGNAKNRLRNDAIGWLKDNNVGWSSDVAPTTGKRFVEDIVDVLWYIDGHHAALGERSCHVPSMFKQFQGYNVPEKHKKRRRTLDNLKREEIASYSTKLFTLSSCSYMKRTEWLGVKEAVLRLGDCLRKYENILQKKLAKVSENHKRLCISDVDDWKVLKPCFAGTPSNMAHYSTLHEALRVATNYEAIFVNDFCPNDRKRRYEYLKNLFTPYKCTMYSYTGARQHLHFIWKMNELDDETFCYNKNQEVKSQLEKSFPKYHSRSMRKEFLTKFGRVIKISSAILREMYQTLVGDSSSSSNLDTEEIDKRVKEYFETEDADLVIDLRANNGRPGEKYSVYLEECQKYISGFEQAVDERRHDDHDDQGNTITHFATALNARTLHEAVCKRLPEGTAIPSLQWLRYQFWPRNACQSRTHTGKLKIKYMVQARQLRLEHVDAHYASAIFRYEKEFSIKFREFTEFVSCDDKHTIKIGEPNFPVAAVERGKRVLCRVEGDKKFFKVADHDFTKASFTPSVHLLLDIPEDIEGSFYRGNVHVGIKDNAFQPSSARRHATELKQILDGCDQPRKPILLLYTDGGPDHNITFVRTQLSLITLFFAQNLDFLCAVRTPPHHSWKNPVERIMSILNLGLNGVGMMRSETMHEGDLKSANNLKAIRKLAEISDFKTEFLKCLQEAKHLLEESFKQLKLKDKYFSIFQPASEADMEALESHLDNIESSLKPDIKKSELNRYPMLTEFLKTHCKSRSYMFSIKKCGESCVFGCKPPEMPADIFSNIYHLPDPVPDFGKEHYKMFEEIYSKDTTEEYRPSLHEVKRKDHGMPFSPTAQYAKNTSTFLQCQQCGRWRCIYSKLKLSEGQKGKLSKFIEDHDYVCGASFSNENDEDDHEVLDLAFVNGSLTCNSVMEKPFYSSCKDIVCFQCGAEDMVDNVNDDNYPLCGRCSANGFKHTKRATRKVKPREKDAQ